MYASYKWHWSWLNHWWDMGHRIRSRNECDFTMDPSGSVNCYPFPFAWYTRLWYLVSSFDLGSVSYSFMSLERERDAECVCSVLISPRVLFYLVLDPCNLYRTRVSVFDWVYLLFLIFPLSLSLSYSLSLSCSLFSSPLLWCTSSSSLFLSRPRWNSDPKKNSDLPSPLRGIHSFRQQQHKVPFSLSLAFYAQVNCVLLLPLFLVQM